MKKILLSVAVVGLLAACGNQEQSTDSGSGDMETDIMVRATEIAQNNIIVDGHIDVPYRLNNEWVDVGAATEGGDFDYPRAVAGGLNAPFFSIYTPANAEAEGQSRAIAERLFDHMERLLSEHPDKFAIPQSVADVRAHFEAGIISIPFGLENGSPIEGNLDSIDYFHERGVRYVTLAHALSNHISDSSYDDNKRWGGLSPFGEKVVEKLMQTGIMIDISHVSDEAFWDVMELTKVPVIASHSSARYFTPGFERNMNDEMIRRLGENGGVIMINYGSSFLTEEANGYTDAMDVAWEMYAEENGLVSGDDSAREAFEAQYQEANPYPFADLTDVLDHIDHVVALAGVNAVGIGSDYDGVGDSLPTRLKDVSSYPTLVAGLLERGYSEEDIRKILGENLLRVWGAVEAYASAVAE